MKRKNNRQCLVDGLKAMGWEHDSNARTAKYLLFHRIDVGRRFLVGKSGALRLLPTGENAIARSLSMERSNIREAMILVGRSSDSWTSNEQAQRAFRQYQSDLREGLTCTD